MRSLQNRLDVDDSLEEEEEVDVTRDGELISARDKPRGLSGGETTRIRPGRWYYDSMV